MQNKLGVISFIISFVIFISLLYQKQFLIPFVRLICVQPSECIFEGTFVFGIFAILSIIGFIISGWLAIISLAQKDAKGINAIYTYLSILLLVFIFGFMGIAIF